MADRKSLSLQGWSKSQIDELLGVATEAEAMPARMEGPKPVINQPKHEPRKVEGKPPCAHYAKGTCTRGDRCRFAHVGAGRSAQRRRPGAQWRNRKDEADDLLRGGAKASNVVALFEEDIAAAPLCSGHGEPCTKLRVDKWGANKGRQYWRCARSGKAAREKCGFFKWTSTKWEGRTSFVMSLKRKAGPEDEQENSAAVEEAAAAAAAAEAGAGAEDDAAADADKARRKRLKKQKKKQKREAAAAAAEAEAE